MKLLRHAEYGYLFEATLTNLYVPGDLVKPKNLACEAPGIVTTAEGAVLRYPLPGEEISSDACVLPAIAVPNPNQLWSASPGKADVNVRFGQKLVATQEVTDRACNVDIVGLVTKLMRSSHLFYHIDFARGGKTVRFPRNQEIRVFASAPDKEVKGIVACIGPPFFCANHGRNPANVQRAMMEWWEEKGPHVPFDFRQSRIGVHLYYHSPESEAITTASTVEDKPKKRKRPKGDVVNGNNLVVKYDVARGTFMYRLTCTNDACKCGTKYFETSSVPVPHQFVGQLREFLGLKPQ
jgi:hypothetical protein